MIAHVTLPKTSKCYFALFELVNPRQSEYSIIAFAKLKDLVDSLCSYLFFFLLDRSHLHHSNMSL